MMNYNNFFGGAMFGGFTGFFVLPILIWSLVWKGWALWKAAKNGSQIWFIILLIVNSVGILEILYIFVFSKMKTSKVPAVKVTSGKGKKK